MKSLPPDTWSRSKALLGLAAGISGHELRHRLRSGFRSTAEKFLSSETTARIEQARLMAESLGRLKGALMKAGQLLSVDASDFLPPEARDLLATLQGNVEPVDFETMHRVLLEDLGADRLGLLELDSEKPAAAASIGQVYRATFEERAIAVKVQYPGVRESIDADLDILEKLASSWLTVSRRDIDIAGVFDELRSILHVEADYDHERACLDRFADLVQGDERFVVPRSLPEMSAGRVLTMSWEHGEALGDWISRDAPMQDRLWLGATLLDLYCLEFFRWGLVQTDPNFGNFLVRSAERRVVLLDFGATIAYEPAFRAGYVNLLRALGSGSSQRVADEGIAFGLIDPRESKETRDLFAEFLHCAVEPFEARGQPFRFRDSEYAARSRDIGRRFTRSLAYSPPPRQLIFLHRKLGGLFQLLKRLDVSLDLRPYWKRMIEADGSAP